MKQTNPCPCHQISRVSGEGRSPETGSSERFFLPFVIGVFRRPRFQFGDVPIRRRIEARAVAHSGEKQQAGSFLETHQLLRQIDGAAYRVQAFAFAPLAPVRRYAFARRGRIHCCDARAFAHPFRRGQVIRREAKDRARVGEERLPAFVIERLQLRQVLADARNLDLVAAHESEGVFERAEMAEGWHFINQEQRAHATCLIERAQRRDNHEPQPNRMSQHVLRGQDQINRCRLLFQLAKIDAVFADVIGDRRRQHPARLRVGG